MIGDSRNIVTIGAPVAVPTGPRGRGIAEVAAEGNLLKLTMSDGQVNLLRLPILEGTATPVGISAEVLELVEASVLPLATKDEVNSFLGSLDEKAPLEHRHAVADVDGLEERLSGVQDAVASITDGVATDEDIANAIAALQLSAYLKSETAANTYARLGHTHAAAEVTGLAAMVQDLVTESSVDLSAYATTAAVNQKITDLNVAQYLRKAEADLLYATPAQVAAKWTAPTTGTTGDVLTWDGSKLTLQPLSSGSFLTKTAADNTYATKAHPHAITDVTGLQAALDGKASSAALDGKQATLPSGTAAGQVLTWNGSAYAPAVAAAASAPPYIERFAMAGVLAVKASATRAYNVSGAARTITRLHAAVGTAPAGSALTAALKVDGTQVGTVNIAAGASTGSTTLSANWPADSYLTVDVTAVGSTTAGADLVVSVRGV